MTNLHVHDDNRVEARIRIAADCPLGEHCMRLRTETGITPLMDVACRITRTDGAIEDVALLCRIDTIDEVQYFQSGGILQHVLDNLTAA